MIIIGAGAWQMINSYIYNNESIFASIGDGVIVTDLLANIIYINHHAETIIGQKAEQVVGKNFDEACKIVHYETRLPMNSPIAEVLRTNTIKGFESSATIIHETNVTYVSATCSTLTDNEKNVIGTITILRDVSRFRRFEMHYYNEEKNLRNILNFAPIGMVLLDSSFKIRDINNTALHIGNISKREAIGGLFGNSFYCENNSSTCGCGPNCQKCDINFAIHRSYELNIPATNLECKKTFLRRGKRQTLWLKIGATPVIINDQRNIIVTLVDITDEKERELTVIKARDFYFSMFEGVPAIVWRSGLQQEWLYVNDYWTKFTGRTGGDGLQHHWLDLLHPDDRDKYFAASMQALEQAEIFQSEIRLLHKSGEYRWLDCVNHPFYDMEGQMTGFIGMGFDVHDRKMAEQALTRYKVLLDKASDIVLFIGLNGQIIEANEAALHSYGYTREEILATTIWEIQAVDYSPDKSMLTSNLDRVFFETVHRRKDGTVFPVEVSLKGTLIDDQEVILSIIRDTTERKLNEQQLKDAKEAAEAGSRAKGEFLANMSHEIRTPINGIVGMIDLTLLSSLDDEQRDNLITAKSCANSLVGIINDILDFSKIEAGKLKIDNINFCLKEVVEEVIRAHLPAASNKQLNLNYLFAAAIPPVIQGDPNRLRQVLNNLISNAIKFTPSGEITVAVKQSRVENAQVELLFSVTDTGIGMSWENIDKLFKPFSQVDGSITRKFGGTGLGLAISKQLVEMMHGLIWVESAPGQGTTFFFTVKCKLGSGLSAKRKISLPASYKTAYPQKILVAEDNKVNQDVVMRLLKEIGHNAEAVNNGLEAWEYVQQHPQDVDLILMDIQMPVKDGLEATAQIREQEAVTGGHIPIIALTAYALTGDKERFLALGMDGYLAKPIAIYELAQAIETVCRKQLGMDEIHNFRINEYGELYSIDPGKQLVTMNRELSKRLLNLAEELQLALVSINIEKVEECAHKLKEEFNKAGLDKLKDLAFKIELAARRANIQQSAEIGEKLLEDIETLLKTHQI